MAVQRKNVSSENLVAVIRPSHWSELAEYLGQPVNRIRETFRLYLQLLDSMGYALIRKGDPVPPGEAVAASPAELIPWDGKMLYSAVEGAILEATEQRLAGVRISDQAEVRAIVRAVEQVVSGARVGA